MVDMFWRIRPDQKAANWRRRGPKYAEASELRCPVPAPSKDETNRFRSVGVQICHSVCGLSRYWSCQFVPDKQGSESLDHVLERKPELNDEID